MINTDINQRFLQVIDEKKIMIVAHRGTVCANIVDNTLESFDIAIRQGADMLEIDVCASLEGDLFVAHDGTESMLFGIDKNLTEMTTREIMELRYLNKNRICIDHPISNLGDVLEHLKHRCLINLDRCWVCWDKVIETVEMHGMADQIVFKSPPEKKYLDFMAAQKTPYMYMPIIWYPKELEYVRASNVNMVAVEIIGYREEAAVMDAAFLQSLEADGIGRLVSAMTLANPIYQPEKLIEHSGIAGSKMKEAILNGRILLAGGHDDDISLLEDPDLGWGWLAERGFNMLMTDWTLDMLLYLTKAGYRV